MKKKIAILEIEFHLGFVKTLVDLIDFKKYSVTIFTTKSNLRDLRHYLGNKVNNVEIKVPKNTLLGFLYNFYKNSKNFDLCFYFTVQDFFFILPFRFLFFPKCKTILIAFRVENYLGNLFHGIEKKSRIIHSIKNFLFNLIRYLIIKRSTAVITNGYRDTKILKTKFNKKKIYEIPFSINSRKFSYNKKKLLTIGVPGAIDKIRRDYFKILNLFQSLSKLKNDILFIFIGSYLSNQQYVASRPDDYFIKLVSEIQKLKRKGYKIKYFKKKLSQKDYEKYLKKSDIMLTYMKSSTYMNHGWTSVYTESIEHNKYLLTNRKNSPKNISFIENNFTNNKSFKKKVINFKKNRYKISRSNFKKIKKYFGQLKYQHKMSSIINEVLKE